ERPGQVGGRGVREVGQEHGDDEPGVEPAEQPEREVERQVRPDRQGWGGRHTSSHGVVTVAGVFTSPLAGEVAAERRDAAGGGSGRAKATPHPARLRLAGLPRQGGGETHIPYGADSEQVSVTSFFPA